MSRPLILAAFAVATAVPTLFALGGCKKAEPTTTTNDPVASEAVDSVDVASSESALIAVAGDSAQSGAKAADVASAAAAAAPSQYAPASCVVATVVSITTVKYTLTDCTGPWGLVHVSGEVDVTFSDASGGLGAHATSTGLHVNGATFDIDATGVLQASGTARTLDVTANSAGTGPRGTKITRKGDYTVTWDTADGCHGLEGDWSTTVGVLAWDTSVTNYERCDAACPAAGGSISWTGKQGRSLTVSFDGTDVAKWKAGSGKTGTIDLLCGG